MPHNYENEIDMTQHPEKETLVEVVQHECPDCIETEGWEPKPEYLYRDCPTCKREEAIAFIEKNVAGISPSPEKEPCKWEEKVLTAVIYGDLEDYDENRKKVVGK